MGNPDFAVLLVLQVFKFIYSCRLAEMGLATQAFHYCEVIAKSILTQPAAYSAVLVSQLVQVRLLCFLLVLCYLQETWAPRRGNGVGKGGFVALSEPALEI